MNHDLAGGEDEEEVEDDVQHAHQDVEGAGNTHIAAAPQHRPRYNVNHEKRHKQHERAEVDTGVLTDVRLGTQPDGQRPAQRKSQSSHQQAHRDGLPHHLPCVNIALGTQQVCHLHGITCGKRCQHALEEPCRGAHEPYRSRVVSSELTHHRSVDELHHHRRHVGEDGGHTQREGQSQLLP